MKSKKPKKTYGRGPNITKTRELAKELRDAVKLTIEHWASEAMSTLRAQGYKGKLVEATITKITDTAYEGLTWKTLHKGEGYNDPFHARLLAEWESKVPGWLIR